MPSLPPFDPDETLVRLKQRSAEGDQQAQDTLDEYARYLDEAAATLWPALIQTPEAP